MLYRITQESAVQHRPARRRPARRGRAVLRRAHRPAVHDDGRGFDPGSPTGGALGLSGMRERALLVGGELSVFSRREGGGTTVELTLEAR